MPCLSSPRPFVALLCGLGLTLLVAPAQAQDARARARQLFESGVAAMDSGNPAAASQRFQQSYQLYPRASTACNMALSLERTNRACEGMNWYRQCAALDTAGTFRDHANRQAAALSRQCPTNAGAPNPFVGGAPTADGAVQVVEGGQPGPYVHHQSHDHTGLGWGIPALLLGVGALVGGGFAAGEANTWSSQIETTAGTADNPTVLPEESEDANRYNQASTFSSLAVGLYVAGGILSALGALLIVVDLGDSGVLTGEAAGPSRGPRLAIGGRPEGGVVGQLTLSF